MAKISKCKTISNAHNELEYNIILDCGTDRYQEYHSTELLDNNSLFKTTMERYSSKINYLTELYIKTIEHDIVTSDLENEIHVVEAELDSLKKDALSAAVEAFKKKYELEGDINSKWLVFDASGNYIETDCSSKYNSIDEFKALLSSKGLLAYQASYFIKNDSIEWYYLTFKEMINSLAWEYNKSK